MSCARALHEYRMQCIMRRLLIHWYVSENGEYVSLFAEAPCQGVIHNPIGCMHRQQLRYSLQSHHVIQSLAHEI